MGSHRVVALGQASAGVGSGGYAYGLTVSQEHNTTQTLDLLNRSYAKGVKACQGTPWTALGGLIVPGSAVARAEAGGVESRTRGAPGCNRVRPTKWNPFKPRCKLLCRGLVCRGARGVASVPPGYRVSSGII